MQTNLEKRIHRKMGRRNIGDVDLPQPGRF